MFISCNKIKKYIFSCTSRFDSFYWYGNTVKIICIFLLFFLSKIYTGGIMHIYAINKETIDSSKFQS